MNTSTYFSLSYIQVSIQLPSGERTSINLPTGTNAKVGDQIIVDESESLITKSKVYSFSSLYHTQAHNKRL